MLKTELCVVSDGAADGTCSLPEGFVSPAVEHSASRLQIIV